jgi:uncharacterized membrane protein
VRRLRFLVGHRLKTSLWFIPVLCVLGGVALSFGTIAIDRASGGIVPTSFTGDPNAALAILSTVAASMVSLTALVLTVTMVVVQLAMGQFSPRSVRPFLHDRPSQIAIGVFVGTFAHAMLAMREVRSFAGAGSVPGITIVTSFVLILVSIAVLVAYVHHIGHSLKVDSIIRAVGNETRGVMDKLYPPDGAAPSSSGAGDGVIGVDRAGVIFRIDHDEVVEAAREARCTLELAAGVGDFVPEGAPLFRVRGDSRRLDERRLRRAVAIGRERTMDQDAAFGIQTLVDVAERSLTDSFNDATTAEQAVDRIHDCLRQLATRPFPSGRYQDRDGELRLVVPVLDWEGFVSLAFDRLLFVAAGTPPVLQRARLALEDIASVAPPERLPPLKARLSAVREALAGDGAAPQPRPASVG